MTGRSTVTTSYASAALVILCAALSGVGPRLSAWHVALAVAAVVVATAVVARAPAPRWPAPFWFDGLAVAVAPAALGVLVLDHYQRLPGAAVWSAGAAVAFTVLRFTALRRRAATTA